MKNFEIFEVSPNVKKLRQFREEYIRTFEGDLVNKIISRSKKWYDYDMGIYPPSKIGLSVKPIAKTSDIFSSLDSKKKNNGLYKDYARCISDFISYGVSTSNQVKALSIMHDNDVEFFKAIKQYFYLLESPQKKGTSYTTDVIRISEDLYNMAMIQYRNFGATTTPEDLSRYAEYFVIGDKSYACVSDEAIYDFQRCGFISEEDALKIIEKLEVSEKATLSLRK